MTMRYIDHYAPDRTLADLEAEHRRRLAELLATHCWEPKKTVRVTYLVTRGSEVRCFADAEAAARFAGIGREMLYWLFRRADVNPVVRDGWTFTRVEQAKG